MEDVKHIKHKSWFFKNMA